MSVCIISFLRDGKLEDRTRAVSIAVVRTVAVLRTGVPTPALGHLLSWLARLAVRCEHVALATAKLVWLLVVVAGEVRATVGGVSVDWVSLEEVLRSECFPPGATKALDLKHFLPVAPPGVLAGLLLPHAAPDLHVKDEGDGARELKGPPVVALNVLVTDVLVSNIEHPVGSLALRVSVWRRFLDVNPVPALHIVRQHAFLVVGDLVIKEETLGAELYICHSLATDVEQIALLKVSELSVRFWTVKVRTEVSVLLGLSSDG